MPTLPRAAYVDDDVWRDERERIWMRQWVVVGRIEEVAASGDRLLVDVAGESIIVARDSKSRLHGFYNVCRHRGAELLPLAAPRCAHAGSVMRCPYHAWTYGLDGRLRAAPHLERDQVPEVSLHPVAVDTWGGFVFVNLSPELAGPLVDHLDGTDVRVARYPLDELRCGATFRYEVAANWKIVAENYNECYHCGPIHPELCDLVPSFRRGGGNQLDWEHGIPHRKGAWTFTTTGTSTRQPFAGLDEQERTRHKGELVYPNLLMSLSAEHVASFRLEPHGPASTTIVCDLFFHPDEIARTDFDPSDAADLWDLVNRQDWAICESVQRGNSSRAWSGGWFSPMEDQSFNITRWYSAAMNDDRD